MKPDFILQIGSTLVSTEIQGVISDAMKHNKDCRHVLIHRHRPTERADPSFTVTHQISAEVVPFLNNVRQYLDHQSQGRIIGSDLASLVEIGRALAERIPGIIHDSSRSILERSASDNANQEHAATLTEPQIVLAISENALKMNPSHLSNLFLSNSMPVRDAEFFLYPTPLQVKSASDGIATQRINSVTVNRGASGIDGIISTATGLAEATSSPTTLLIGDLSTIHDLNALHNLGHRGHPDGTVGSKSIRGSPQLTTVVVNNNGGGIFSFLPIAKYGSEVGYEEFFGTPTDLFSFSKGADDE